MAESQKPAFKISWELLKTAIVLAVSREAGVLAAKFIIDLTGAVNGHIDAGCAANPDCVNAILEIARSLPTLTPIALLGLTRIGPFLVRSCSNHPDGGKNLSITGKMQ